MPDRRLRNICSLLLIALALCCLAGVPPFPLDPAAGPALSASENYRGGGSEFPPADPGSTIYVVRSGDTLSGIAARFHVTVSAIMALNGIKSADSIYIGQRLLIPAGGGGSQPAAIAPGREGPSDKLIPDSELVYSPAYENFDVTAFAQKYGGYLSTYTERVDGVLLTGPQIIQLLSERFSVGPRVLLTILEMRSGWVTGQPFTPYLKNYPMNLVNKVHTGLYYQAWHAADFLNEGYYAKLLGRQDYMTLTDNSRAHFADGINPGTAGVQFMLSHSTSYGTWLDQLGPNGFTATYQKLFGDPYANAIEPLVPPGLQQPLMRLPFEDGHMWYFTGGAHGAWADGSAWAAIDFAGIGPGGCTPSPEWEVAVAPGNIVQAEQGRVMLNLSGSNFQGTGWTVMYMHVFDKGRVQKGSYVFMGDHIGHPSCEGGAATASHLHIARMYNGQWLSVASDIPFDLGGWTFKAAAVDYDGTMTRGSETKQAINGHNDRLNGVTGEMGPEIMALVNLSP